MAEDMSKPYKRLLVKLSGEALMGEGAYGIDMPTVSRIARDIKTNVDNGLEICLVIGGGNIFRGLAGAAQGMDRASADYMGMLATIMNSLAMQNALEQVGIPARVLSATSAAKSSSFFSMPSQTFVIDGENTVEAALKAAEDEVGGPIEILAFTRFGLGEGIEKKEEDFAAEVAAAAGGS